MLKAEKVVVKNYVTFRDAVLRLRSGVTVIHGKNLDRPEKKSSNGSGKSLLVGVIPSIRYGQAPLPMKATKKPKEGFTNKTEQVIFFKDAHNNTHEVKKFFKGTTRIDIIKNGKSAGDRAKGTAQERLEKLIPLNEEQFYSLAYLDTKRPPILQYGTDAQRHHFIEKLYQLDVYDKLGALIKKDWDKTQLLVQEMDVLDRQLSEKSRDVRGDPEELKREQKKLVKKTEDIRTKVVELLAQLEQCKTYLALSEGVDLSENVGTLFFQVQEGKKKLVKYRERYDSAVENNKRREAYEDIKQQRESIEKKLAEYKDVVIDKTVQTEIEADKKLLDKIEEQETENEDVREELEEIKKERDVASLFKHDELSNKHKQQALKHGSEALERQVVREKALYKDVAENLRETTEHFENHDDKTCPICSTVLTKEIQSTIIKDKETRLKSINKKIGVLQLMQAYASTQEKIKDCDERYKQTKKRIVKPNEDRDNIEQRLKKNEARLHAMRQKVILKKKLAALPEARALDVIDTAPIKEKIGSFEESVSALSRRLNGIKQLAKLELPFTSRKAAKDRRAEVETELKQYQPLLDKLTNRLNRVSVDAVRTETLSEEIASLSKQIEELKLKTADHKITSALRKVLGPRGIRKQKVAEIGAAIETTMNDYAKLIYDFPIAFELQITDTRFAILAHRNGSVSDVRSLSGAESRYFSILTMMTLLKFCPDQMRVDFVVLDEIEANLDEPFVRRYVDVVLPLINEVVPKVIVVTPKSEREMFIPKAQVYVVRKENNVSTLQKV